MKNLYLLSSISDDPRFEGFAFEAALNGPLVLGRPKVVHDLDPTAEFELGLPCRSLIQTWTPPKVEGRVRPFNDFPMVHPFPAFSQRAIEALGDLLDGNGELLPLVTDAGAYFLFHVTRVADILDIEQSDIEFQVDHPNIALVVRKFAIRANEFPTGAIFKFPQLPRDTFVTQDFLERVESTQLKGFRFYHAWPTEHGYGWGSTPVDIAGAGDAERKKAALKANTIVLMFATRGSGPDGDELGIAEQKRIEIIVQELDGLLRTGSLDDEVYRGAVELYDIVSGMLRLYISCPDAEKLAKVLEPWQSNLKWWPTRVTMIVGDYDFREAPPEIIPKLFHDE